MAASLQKTKILFKNMQDEVKEKKHNTAETSRETFIALSNEGRLIDQKKTIYQAISDYQPITSRSLANMTGHERSSVCRSLYDLLNEINPSIKVCFVDKCEITGRRVKHYSLIDWNKPVVTEKDNGSRELFNVFIQPELFLLE